ncbi:hypothetical protein BV20DRAFT_968597 [Pilatotrama ljubarskyi]|nr:hypothetical protein BV20DRAFT_968597 [Pilatotrama ljubarskyi]
MRRSSESPVGGSAHKRRRLSSPTYEEHFGPISQEDVRAFDEVEMRLSQSVPLVPSQSRALPSEEMEFSIGMEGNDLLGGEDNREVDGEGRIGQEWSSSPLANPLGTQDRAAEDDFFTTDSSTRGGFVSAASMSDHSKPPSGLSGFASAAALPGSPTPAQFNAGFASAAKLPAPSQSRPAHESTTLPAASPFVPPRFSGFGRASALPVQSADYRALSASPPPQERDYDSWFDNDASALPPDAFGFQTARAVLTSSEHPAAAEMPASQAAPSQLAGFTSGLAQWHSASQVDQDDATPPQDPASADLSVGFTSAAALPGFAPASQAGFSSAAAAQVGFSSAAQLNGGKSSWAAPSEEALARAAQRMKQWEAEFDREEDSPSASGAENNAPASTSPSIAPSSTTPLQTPARPALRPMENGFSSAQAPDTPSPAGPGPVAAPKSAPHYTVVAGMQIKNKPFKSPLVNRPQAQPRSVSAPSPYVGSPLNPARSTGFRVASGSRLPAAFSDAGAVAGPPNPAQTGPGTSAFVSPVKANTASSSSSFVSPVKALGMTPRRMGISGSVGKGKFSSPFKPGLARGDPGRSQLEQKLKEEQARAASAGPMQIHGGATRTPSRKGKEKKTFEFFDLNPPPERKNLATSGLRPLSYAEEDLEDMGINVEELRQMRPSNAIYYRFHSAVATVGIEDPAESEQLGPKAAFVQLKERDCDLVTQEWVTNHYGLILWKLAGLVCLEPDRELNPKTKRWCWPEVIKQLLYRYERELNGGSRPALRLVCTEDAPATCPMILCVSNIVIRGPGSPGVDRNGRPLETVPELEVTDGWYRLRASVDMPLARAIRRGRICIGTKLAVSGAKLSGDRKEACEILEAYDNTCLELTGNSTNLAPWHAKLGFVKDPFIATLDKLTPDGGVVPALDVIITKTYPIAFIEFVRNEDGSVSRIGPRDEKEEMKAHDQWLAKREAESSKIREKLQSEVQHLLKLSERLYSRTGPKFELSFQRGDPMPDHIEPLYDEMMEDYLRPSQAWDRIDALTAGWLHVYCKQQADAAAARMGEDLARELQHACPPRNVRDFRVVVAKDARWRKKEPMRTAQITLWDPLKVVFSESGNPGEIKEGQRFLVTNLIPNQPDAWMVPAPDAEVYLVSKRTSRWTNIKSGDR